MAPSPLQYKVISPPVISSNMHPLLILLHGRGTDENDLLGIANAFSSDFIFVSIRGPYAFPYGGYTWFEADDRGNFNIDQLLSSGDLIIQCLDEIEKTYQVDPHRTFLFGFSMGAMVSLTTALFFPQRIKAVVAHSGLLLQHPRH